jgi:putative peptidoglycan lipid II flippase
MGQAPGFAIPVAIASVLGATRQTDALFLAFALCSFVVTALTSAAQDAAVPFLVSHREGGGDSVRYLGEAVSALLMTSLVLTAVVLIAGSALLRSSIGFGPGESNLGERLLFVFAPFVVLSGLSALGNAALNAERAYAAAAVSPAIRSVVVLGALFLLARFIGPYAVAAGYVAGEFCRLSFLVGALHRAYRRPVLPRRVSRGLRTFFQGTAAQFAGSAVLGAVPLVDRFWANRLGAGSVSLLDYAERLWQVPLGFLMSGFMVVSLSRWSVQLYKTGDRAQLDQSTRRTAFLLCLVSLPLCAVAVVWRLPLISLVFSAATLSEGELVVLANAFGAYVAGIPVYVAGLVFARSFLVLKRSELLLGVAVVQLAVKCLLNSVLSPVWGIPGIAMATSATLGLGSLMLVGMFELQWFRRAAVPFSAR